MKKLITKGLLLLLPFCIMVSVFIILDPLKVIHEYPSPTTAGVMMNDRLYQAKWLNKKSENYDAFIFGSSRSKAFKTWNWEKLLPEKVMPFHLGVNDETLFGVLKKLEYLDRNNYKIKYALFPIDHRILQLQENQEAHIFREYYEVSGEAAGEYYKKYFTAFLNPNFLKYYFEWKKTGVISKEKNEYLWDPGFEYIQKNGDIIYARMDKEISNDSSNYYNQEKSIVFYERKESEAKKLLNEKGIKMLQEIKNILVKHNTNYQIIITPNYDLKKINSEDFKTMKRIFDSTKVSDFSGLNEHTNDYKKFYEERHFKPYIANQVMKISYSKSN